MSFDAVWAAVQAVFLVTMLGLLLRWPGRLLGLGAALVLWTVVGPWAFWAALGVVAVGAVAWPRIRQGERLLVAHPELQLALVGAVVAVLMQGWVGLVGLIVAMAVVIRLAWSWPPLVGRRKGADVVPAGAQQEDPWAAPSGFLSGGPVVTDVTQCQYCGGRVVGTAQLPAPGQHLGVAHAACEGCDLRLVGVVDTTAPPGQQVTWMEPPDTQQWERSA